MLETLVDLRYLHSNLKAAFVQAVEGPVISGHVKISLMEVVFSNMFRNCPLPPLLLFLLLLKGTYTRVWSLIQAVCQVFLQNAYRAEIYAILRGVMSNSTDVLQCFGVTVKEWSSVSCVYSRVPLHGSTHRTLTCGRNFFRNCRIVSKGHLGSLRNGASFTMTSLTGPQSEPITNDRVNSGSFSFSI